jgi:hypothetical protein
MGKEWAKGETEEVGRKSEEGKEEQKDTFGSRVISSGV